MLQAGYMMPILKETQTLNSGKQVMKIGGNGKLGTMLKKEE